MKRNSIPARDLRNSILLGVALGLGVGIIFAAGFFFRDAMSLISPAFISPANTNYPLLNEVQALVGRQFLREQPSYEQSQYGVIRGFLMSLNDPYTFFIEPPVAAMESDALAGTYGGIGVQIQRNAEGQLVLYPFAESAAMNAGVENGDILYAVNGNILNIAVSLDEVERSLRGEVKEGIGVEISIEKWDTREIETMFIPFAVINVPSVIWRVLPENPSVGYIQILRFTGRTPDELRNGINDLRSVNIESLVLDLRNNSGGLLQESIAVADEFIDSGILVYERNNREEKSYEATTGGLAIDLPLIVLVNERTASGAELVAGAIQDFERGVLIGQRTFGKGTVQQIFPLSDRSSIHVTSAEWLTPNRQALNGNGLTPDVALIADPEGRDIELAEAIRYLEGESL